jgi:hypothetical protein
VEEQDWTRVVAAATRAPSIHNTQPWRFAATADRIDVFLDRDRALPVLDPTGRQQIISCCSAIEFQPSRCRPAVPMRWSTSCPTTATPTTWPGSG